MENKPTTCLTLRIPDTKSAYLRRKAAEIGISQNSLILMLMDIGIKTYEGYGSGSTPEAGASAALEIR